MPEQPAATRAGLFTAAAVPVPLSGVSIRERVVPGDSATHGRHSDGVDLVRRGGGSGACGARPNGGDAGGPSEDSRTRGGSRMARPSWISTSRSESKRGASGDHRACESVRAHVSRMASLPWPRLSKGSGTFDGVLDKLSESAPETRALSSGAPPATPQAPLHRLVTRQRADGSWDLTDALRPCWDTR